MFVDMIPSTLVLLVFPALVQAFGADSLAHWGGKRGFAVKQVGSCRGVDNGVGVTRDFDVSVEECRKICLGDPACTAIEYKPAMAYKTPLGAQAPLSCEVHTEPIGSVFVKSCYVKSPSQFFVKEQGSCRDLDGGRGVYQIFEGSVEECRKMCLGDPKCTAIEDKSLNLCEIHTAPIGSAQTKLGICQLVK